MSWLRLVSAHLAGSLLCTHTQAHIDFLHLFFIFLQVQLTCKNPSMCVCMCTSIRSCTEDDSFQRLHYQCCTLYSISAYPPLHTARTCLAHSFPWPGCRHCKHTRPRNISRKMRKHLSSTLTDVQCCEAMIVFRLISLVAELVFDFYLLRVSFFFFFSKPMKWR